MGEENLTGGGEFNDIMASLKSAGYQPEVVEDSSFSAFKGSYICRIESCSRQKGLSKRDGKPYDFISLSLQVAEVVSGDPAINRYIKKNYNWEDKGVKKFLNDMFTAGLDAINASTDAELEMFLATLTDKLVNVSAWVGNEWTDKSGKVHEAGNQMSKIVKEFKVKKAKVEGEAVPF